MAVLQHLALLACLLAVPDGAADPAPPRAGAVELDARAAEHLLSRAGFGATTAEVERAVHRGLDATVAELLAGPEAEPFFVSWPRLLEPGELAALERDERSRRLMEERRADRRRMEAYEAWWAERMLAGEDPLRERMTLFWHGFFTSSYADVRRAHEMIAQHQLLRANALGSYAAMLRGIVRDPAMLRYLGNDRNRRESPNENLARELLELFTLGPGNYTEEDVKEVARALTGYFVTREGRFRFARFAHDGGRKVVLGERGRFDGDAVVEVLLRQDACARHVAGRILAYFEGVEPDAARREEYAAVLREGGYAISPLLAKLFTDPRFYREEIVGARVASPIDFLAGACKRLEVRPPARLVALAAARLGQRLFHPPNVKGWEEGPAWITSATMLQRGNVAGLLLGTIDPREPARPALDVRVITRGGVARAAEELDEDDDDAPAMDGAESMDGVESMDRRARPPAAARGPALPAELVRALGEAWRPSIHLTWRLRRAGAASDLEIAARIARDLLAIEPPPDTVARLARYVAGEREAREIPEGALLADEQASEEVLRRLAHLVLSSPEAQLH